MTRILYAIAVAIAVWLDSRATALSLYLDDLAERLRPPCAGCEVERMQSRKANARCQSCIELDAL